MFFCLFIYLAFRLIDLLSFNSTVRYLLADASPTLTKPHSSSLFRKDHRTSTVAATRKKRDEGKDHRRRR